MKVRIERTKEFYPTAVTWWERHNFPTPHKLLLPPNVFIVSDDSHDLFCCWLYRTDSLLAYLAYPISNLDSTKEQRKGALQFLLNEIEVYAKKEGFAMIYTTSPIVPVIEALTSEGYIEGDLLVNQYFKQVT